MARRPRLAPLAAAGSIALLTAQAGAQPSMGHMASGAWTSIAGWVVSTWMGCVSWTLSAAQDGIDTAHAFASPSTALAPEPGLYRPVNPASPCGNPAPGWMLCEADDAPDRLVILVHGLDEPGCVWNDLAPALVEEGYEVARFEYPNDQPIADSAALLRGELARLGAAGVGHVDFVAHSMGGLVLLDALTHPGGANSTPGAIMPRVERVITVGTPFEGSPWARARCVTEAREQYTRWKAGDHAWTDLTGGLADGHGQAGTDLLPGSTFFQHLVGRSMPQSVEWTALVARLVPDWTVEPSTYPALGAPQSAWNNSVDWLGNLVGDGVVTMRSASAAPSDDVTAVASGPTGLWVATRAGYARLFAAHGFEIDADSPSQTVLFPEMDESVEVPEITTACWDILGKSPDAVMCAGSNAHLALGTTSPIPGAFSPVVGLP